MHTVYLMLVGIVTVVGILGAAALVGVGFAKFAFCLAK